jgi:hypothetical protein
MAQTHPPTPISTQAALAMPRSVSASFLAGTCHAPIDGERGCPRSPDLAAKRRQVDAIEMALTTQGPERQPEVEPR